VVSLEVRRRLELVGVEQRELDWLSHVLNLP
jgi:hypothetical protein